MSSKRYIKWLICSLLFIFMLIVPLFAQEKEKEKSCDEMASEIKKLKSILNSGCSEVRNMMAALFFFHNEYLYLEKSRYEIFVAIQDSLAKRLGDFIWTKPKDEATVNFGTFKKRFLDIAKRANDIGVLAPGPISTGGKSIGRYALGGSSGMRGVVEDMKDSKGDYYVGTAKYFYYDENPSSRKKKADTIEKLKDEYDALVKDWDKAREDFYRWFDDPEGDISKLTKYLKDRKNEQVNFYKKYNETAEKLKKLAYSGDYEHCLGKIEPAKTYSVVKADDPLSIASPLYKKGDPNTVDAIPGMGCVFPKMAEYPEIKKPVIPDFPEKIYFKLDAVKWLEFERDLLQTKIEAEEDAIAAYGGMIAKFGIDTAYVIAEGFAPIGDLLIYLVKHPIKSAETAADALIWVAKAGPAPVMKEGVKFGDALITGIATGINDGIKNIAALGNELISYKDRLNASPEGKPLPEQIKLLDIKFEATSKVTKGVETLADITGLAAQLAFDIMTGGAATPGTAKYIAKGVDKVVDAEKLVARASAVEKKLQAGTKIADALEKEAQVVQKVEAIAGKPLPSSEIKQVLKFTDDAGKAMDLPVGKKLGSGATSDVFEYGADNSKVVRLTELSSASAQKAQALDKFGKGVLDDLGSPYIRSAKLEKEVVMVNEQGVKVQVQVVEKVKPANAWIAEQGGKLTEGQRLALEQATRDINAKGYAWIDNHTGNYAFEKLPGEDKWRVIVHDTGGIYPMKGTTLAERAENARNLQKVMVETQKEIDFIGNPNMYASAFRDKIYDFASNATKGVDLTKVGLTDVKQIGIGAARDIRPDLSDLIKKSDSEIKKLLGAEEKATATDLAKAKEGVKAVAEEQLTRNQKMQEIIKKNIDEANKNLDSAMKKVNEPIEKPFEGKRTEVVDKITAKDNDGKDVTLELGRQLGKGGTTTASINAANDAQVIKVISLDKPEQVVQHKLNDFGAKAIKEIKSDVIEIAEVKGVYHVEDLVLGKQVVEVVERVKNTAKEIFDAQHGKFTPGQQLAFEKAMRDLNAKGYAWLDNHYDNYTFVQLPGTDRWKVVVIDPGNIVKMKGTTLEEMAREARNVQTRVNNINLKDPGEIQAALQKALKEKNMDEVKRLQEAMKEFDSTRKEILGSVDLKAMNLTEGDTNYIGFAVRGGVRPSLGDVAKLTDKELASLVTSKSDEVFKSLYGKSSDEFIKSLDQEVSNKILNDPEYKRLLAEYESGKKKLDEVVKELQAKITDAEKEASGLGVSKRTAGEDEAIKKTKAASEDNTKSLEELLNKEKCASIRIAILGGARDEALLNTWKKCVNLGIFQ